MFSAIYDVSTDEVLKWIPLDRNIVRLNKDVHIENISFSNMQITIHYPDCDVELNQCSSIWCRRSGGTVWNSRVVFPNDKRYFEYLFNLEYKTIRKALLNNIEKAKHINNIEIRSKFFIC